MKKTLFKNKTLKEKVSLFLLSRDYKEVESRNKARIFISPKTGIFYFVLENGFLRKGKTAAISSSFSIPLNKEIFLLFCKEEEEKEERK